MIRIGFYSLTALAALIGLYHGLSIVGPHLIDRLSGRSYTYEPETLFRGVVVLFLSLIVIILVHLAHRLARVFELPAKSVSPERPASDVAGTPWEKNPGFTER